MKDFVCSASSSGGQLPASFVAPTMGESHSPSRFANLITLYPTVNMDDFPPPTRRLTKGVA